MEIWKERGIATPSLDAKPRVRADLEAVADMYLDLRQTAGIGTARATVPFASSELIEWADLHGSVSEEDRRTTVRLLMACDQVWRVWASEEKARRSAIES